MPISFDVGSMRATVIALRNAGVNLPAAARAAAGAAATVLRDRLAANVSLRDHSPADMVRAGHPYARRHGRPQIHMGASPYLATPGAGVHTQSGALLRSLYRRYIAAGSARGWRVGLDARRAPHVAYVLQGTRSMLARDVVIATAWAPGTQREMMAEVVRVFGQQFRAQAAVRFESAPTPGGTV